jgi:hypothetical protein
MTRQHGAFARWSIPAAFLALGMVALAGCSQPKAKVVGKVTYKGEAVPMGTVAFYGPGDQVASAALRPDGNYEAIGVPLGEVKVTVTTPPPEDPAAVEKAKTNPMVVRKNIADRIKVEKVVSVPRKYNLPGTSGLSLTVTGGSQPFDIPLQ